MFDIFVLRPPSVNPMWVANVPDALSWMAKPKYKKRKKDMMIASDGSGEICSYAYVIDARNIAVYDRKLRKCEDSAHYHDHYGWNTFCDESSGYDIIHGAYNFDTEKERDSKIVKLLIVLGKVLVDIYHSVYFGKHNNDDILLEAIRELDDGILPRNIKLEIVNLSSLRESRLSFMKLWVKTNPTYSPKGITDITAARAIYTYGRMYPVARFEVLGVVGSIESAVGKKEFTKLLKHHFPIEKMLEIV